VDERSADGVVAVPRRGGKTAAALVQGECEQFGVGSSGFVNPTLPGGDPRSGAHAGGGEDLDTAVAPVDSKRDVRISGQGHVDVVYTGGEDTEQLAELGQHRRVRPQECAASWMVMPREIT
jgi:hypothetical protein